MDERVPVISQPLLLFFRRIVRQNFRRTFHAVRLHGVSHARDLGGPLIVYANHSSWWDPMCSFLLADTLFHTRRHYAPIDGEALSRYRILGRLGMFAVDSSTARGAVQFLRTGEAILRAGGVLWITPQGRFADVREQPLAFKPGLAALAARVPGCRILPLAIEYPFWNERTPETLLSFGQPVLSEGEPTPVLEARLLASLQTLMTDLKTRSISRDPQQFETTLLRGRVGVGGFYGLGQQIRSWVARTPYQQEHSVATLSQPAISDAAQD